MPLIPSDIFPDAAVIDPHAPADQRAHWPAIPAKGAVYLLVNQDEAGEERPVLLATVGDLRSALKRRLGDAPPEVKTKRVAYGEFCTRVHWRRVDSAFAANYWYQLAAHTLMPQTAAALIPWRASWWIAVEKPEPGVPFPRFRKTTDLSDPNLAYVGPLYDKHVAQRLIESLEDLFDLCRYYNILIQAPHGKPCAYKEMGKCPAPCDGSVSLTAYRAQIDAALAFAGDRSRGHWRADMEAAMKSAAGQLQFERAGKIKQRLSRAGALDVPPFNHLAPLEDFAYLTLQPGKGKPWLEPWILSNGRIECLPQIQRKTLAVEVEPLAAACRERFAARRADAMHQEQRDQIALVAHHLFEGEADHGVWLRLNRVAVEREGEGSRAILEAAEKLFARKTSKPLVEQSSDVLEARKGGSEPQIEPADPADQSP